MFARAIDLDPTYVLAYAGTADCYSLLYTYWDPDPANLDQADMASRKALELDVKSAEAHVARGLALTLRKAYEAAESEFRTAVELAPTLFEAYYFHGRACLAQGKLLDAARLFEQACRLRPEDYQASSHLGSIYGGLGRKADAQAAARRTLQVTEKHLELHPDDARAMYLGAVAYSQMGDRDCSLTWATRAVSLDPNEPVTLYNVACVYSLQGRVEEAVAYLKDAVRLGFAHKEWIQHDGDLNAVREHPGYVELMQAFG
jgi:adenylate cyclase